MPCDLLFVGEAPGPTENIYGLPFIGEAGQLLDKVIEIAGLHRHWSIGFTNAIMCYPDDGDGTFRQPKRKEISNCEVNLFSIIDLVRPQYVVRVGKISQNIDFDGIETIDIYHPSYMLRSGGEDSPAFREALCELSNIPPF